MQVRPKPLATRGLLTRRRTWHVVLTKTYLLLAWQANVIAHLVIGQAKHLEGNGILCTYLAAEIALAWWQTCIGAKLLGTQHQLALVDRQLYAVLLSRKFLTRLLGMRCPEQNRMFSLSVKPELN
jgi:hypothetical protein